MPNSTDPTTAGTQAALMFARRQARGIEVHSRPLKSPDPAPPPTFEEKVMAFARSVMDRIQARRSHREEVQPSQVGSHLLAGAPMGQLAAHVELSGELDLSSTKP